MGLIHPSAHMHREQALVARETLHATIRRCWQVEGGLGRRPHLLPHLELYFLRSSGGSGISQSPDNAARLGNQAVGVSPK